MAKKITKKKKLTYSKPLRKTATLSDGTKVGPVPKSYYERIRQGRIGKHDNPPKSVSTETGVNYESHKVTDDYDSLEYPPPSKHPAFRKFWAETIEDLVNRENFKPTHLGLLETYCRLRVDLRRLDDFIMEYGHTYRVVTAMGEVRKPYPEVLERHKILNAIYKYSQLLDLKPAKDKSGSVKDTEDDEWS